jgi:hypothetical protein
MVKPNSKQSPSSSSRQELADLLKKGVANYYRRKRRVCYFELGLNRGGKLRADVFVLAMSGHIVVVEVKSCVADFSTFPAKAESYQQHCNQLYLAVTRAVYLKVKERIPKGVGVFIFNPEDWRTRPRLIRATSTELDADVKQNLFIRAAFRNADTSNRKNKRA